MNPSSNVGSIEYSARIDTKQLRADAAQVDRISHGAAKNLGDNIERGESRVSKLMGGLAAKVRAAAVATGVALGTAGAAAAAFGLKSAADFEQTRIGLENMLGSADKARVLLKDISDFAAQTPFEFPELAQATRQLVAFGFTGKQAFETMKQLGDVSAAVGAPINDLAYLMGTLRTQGRAFTVDIRQFAQRGIPIYEYLAKVLNTTEKSISSMIEEGKIGFPEVQKAFKAMTSEGGKFYNTMDKQSQSLSGQFSTLKDNLGATLRELVGISKTGDVIQGSLFDKVRKGIGNVNAGIPGAVEQMKEWGRVTAATADRVSNYLLPKLSALWGTINKDFMPAIRELVTTFGPTVGAGLVWALGLAIDALNLLLKVATPVIKWMADNTWVVWSMVGAFAAIKTALAIQGAVVAFSKWMAITRAEMVLTSNTALATTGRLKALRVALLLLRGPWQIALAVIGVGAVVYSLKTIKGMIDKISRGIDDLNKKRVSIPIDGGGDLKVSGGSGLGLVQQIRNAFGFRAAGGPVSAGKPYVVGERQPEVFVPRTSGTILPDVGDAIGGSSVTISLNMSGVMTSSRSDLRTVAKDMIESLNEELRAKGIAQIGGGQLGVRV